jgi:predicted nucleotidyltransferase
VTDHYVERLIGAHKGIAEVWLFGSRADGKPGADSDWDYMVFLTDQREFNAICQDRDLDKPEIDLFVVVGSRAMRPWPVRDGQNKVLLLDASPEGMNWAAQGATATYQSREERRPGSPSFETVVRQRVAIRVHPRP